MDALSREELGRCCGSRRWAERMQARQPFADFADLLKQADEVWWSLEPADWLEAFTHHPRIGDKEALRQKWAAQEQAGAARASEAVLDALAAGNAAYEKKYGHIFIVCATGKTAPEMLELLRARMNARPEDELRAAAGEQAKITRIRLEKIFKEKK
jgi:2-oxo-4-hydroxy-4-carboxy-5-ureidoimidazoline decarboxylase